MREPFIVSSAETNAGPIEADVRDLGDLTTPEIQDAALEVRGELIQKINALPTADPRYRRERLRLVRERVVTKYLSVVQEIRAAASDDALKELQSTLVKRLQHGYRLKPNPTRDALWTRLLAEYEIVTDCLAENALWRWQDRLSDIEARWH